MTGDSSGESSAEDSEEDNSFLSPLAGLANRDSATKSGEVHVGKGGRNLGGMSLCHHIT